MPILTAALLCAAPIVTDGDTIRCAGGQRLRLIGIDAPDKPAYCARKGRTCTMAQWSAAKASLEAAVRDRRITYRVVGRDKYGRIAAQVFANRSDLSCYQLRRGQAEFKSNWNGRHLNCKPKGY